MNNILILSTMLFLHIVDDYKLQGILANMKQIQWWKNHPEYTDKYKYDYIPALIEHSYSWSFMIMLPIILYLKPIAAWWVSALIINMIIHAVIDDLKANKLKINLIVDQSIHILQIFITWLVFISI